MLAGEREHWIVPIVFVASLAGFLLINRGRRAWLDYFVPLAWAFLHGHLGVGLQPAYLNELVPFGGDQYVVYPPMPAVLLVPLVALFGPEFDQARLSVMLGAGAVAIATDALGLLGLKGWKRLVMGLTLGFGTIFWNSVQLGTSWHIAHVVATFFTWLAIRTTLKGGNPLLVGLWAAAAGLSRLPVLAAVPFYAVALGLRAWDGEEAHKELDLAPPPQPAPPGGRSLRLWRAGIGLALGFGVPLLWMALYNAARFGSPLQMGYWLIPGVSDEEQYQVGLFHPVNITRNLSAMWLSWPRALDRFPYLAPHPLGGLSLLLTSPWLLGALRASWKDLRTWGAWLAVLAVSAPILLHGDVGGEQFGYRYAQDFYPFLVVLTAWGMRGRMGWGMTGAIALAWLVNAWGIACTVAGWKA